MTRAAHQLPMYTAWGKGNVIYAVTEGSLKPVFRTAGIPGFGEDWQPIRAVRAANVYAACDLLGVKAADVAVIF